MENSKKNLKKTEILKNSIGPYIILEKLGKGAMGIVYKVKSTKDNQIYALKIITETSNLDEENIERFKREIEILEKIEHPNIIKIRDHGIFKGKPYFVMDYINGVSLDKFVEQKGKLNYKEAIEIIYPIVLALADIHLKGIVHRDIKPQNIMITPEKKVYLMDFSIAKTDNKQEHSLTQTGTILGTPNYMSPEQARGRKEEIGPWSDIYSLGLTLYYLLTLHTPFKGENIYDILLNLTGKKVEPLRKFNPDVPSQLEKVINKAIAKDYRKRYKNALELGEDLYKLLYLKEGKKEKDKKKRKEIYNKKKKYKVKIEVFVLSIVFLLLMSIFFILSYSKRSKIIYPKKKLVKNESLNNKFSKNKNNIQKNEQKIENKQKKHIKNKILISKNNKNNKNNIQYIEEELNKLELEAKNEIIQKKIMEIKRGLWKIKKIIKNKNDKVLIELIKEEIEKIKIEENLEKDMNTFFRINDIKEKNKLLIEIIKKCKKLKWFYKFQNFIINNKIKKEYLKRIKDKVWKEVINYFIEVGLFNSALYYVENYVKFNFIKEELEKKIKIGKNRVLNLLKSNIESYKDILKIFECLAYIKESRLDLKDNGVKKRLDFLYRITRKKMQDLHPFIVCIKILYLLKKRKINKAKRLLENLDKFGKRNFRKIMIPSKISFVSMYKGKLRWPEVEFIKIVLKLLEGKNISLELENFLRKYKDYPGGGFRIMRNIVKRYKKKEYNGKIDKEWKNLFSFTSSKFIFILGIRGIANLNSLIIYRRYKLAYIINVLLIFLNVKNELLYEKLVNLTTSIQSKKFLLEKSILFNGNGYRMPYYELAQLYLNYLKDKAKKYFYYCLLYPIKWGNRNIIEKNIIYYLRKLNK